MKIAVWRISFSCILAAAAMPAAGIQAKDANEQLPASAEKRLVSELHAEGVASMEDVHTRRIEGCDYLGFITGLEVKWSFEGVYHQWLVLRKKSTEGDWSKAEVFRIEVPPATLFGYKDGDFLKALKKL